MAQNSEPRGNSPISQVRGVALLGALRALRHHRDQALDLLAPKLHHYLVDKVLMNGWYPEQDLLDLLDVVAVLRAKPGADVWAWMGERMAQTDLGGIVASALAPSEPAALLERLPALWTLYRSVGELKVEKTGHRAARVEVQDYPFVSEKFCRLMQGYLAEAFRLSGGENVEVKAPGPAGSIADPTPFEVTW